MEIINSKLEFAKDLIKREITDYIVLHHPDWESCSVEDIHNDHIKKGWSGIGYHILIRKDGKVYEGRPLWAIGAHVYKKNSISIGVCFEGAYDTKDLDMPYLQFQAGLYVLKYLKELYPNAKIVQHNYFGGTSCPGRHFPDEKMIETALYYESETLARMAIDKLNAHGIINSPNYWYANAKEGKTVKGEYIQIIFERIVKKGLL